MENSQSKSTIDSLQSSDMQSSPALKILIVDDAESDRLTYSRYLQSDSERNYRVIEAETLEEGLELWRSQQPDIVLIELNLPDGNGLTFLEAINIDHADRVPVIMLTGQGNEKMAVNAMKLGASDYLLKGDVTAKLLTTSIRQVMRETALLQQLKRSQLSYQAELEERNKLLERISEELHCTVEELKVSAEEKIEQHRLLQYEEDRKVVEAALFVSEAQSRAILATIPDFMVIIGADGNYRQMVTPHRDFLVHFENSDLVGRAVSEVLPPEAAQQQNYYLQKAIQTGELQVFEQQLQIGDRLQYEEVRIIKSGEDEALFMIRDISDRKVAEEALRASEAKSRIVLETIPDLMFRIGADQVYREIVSPYRDIALFPNDCDLVGLSVADVLPPEAVQRQLHYLQQALQTGELQIYEQQIQIGDRLQYEEVRIIKSGEDEALFMIRDISDRKLAERALQQLNQLLEAKVRERTQELWQVNQLLQTVLDAFPLSVFWKDRESVYLGCNQLFALTTNLKFVQDIIGQNDFDCYDEAQALAYRADDLQVTESGIPKINFEEMMIMPTGEQRWVQTNKIPLRNTEGNVIGVMGTFQDISDRKQAELQLKETTDRLALALNSGAIGCWEWDIQQNLLVWDARMYELYGDIKRN